MSPPRVTMPWMRSVWRMCWRRSPIAVCATVRASAALIPNSGKAEACASLPVYRTQNWVRARTGGSTASTGAGCTIIAACTPMKAPRSRRRILPPPPSAAGVPMTRTVRPTSSATRPAAIPAPAAVGAADEDVGRDAPEVVDHVVVDEAGEAAVVRPDLGPGRWAAGRHLAVVDRRAVAVVVDDEVPGPREPGERLVVVAPELAAPRRRPAEALLEEREGGERVLPLEDDLAERWRVGRHQVRQRHMRSIGHGYVKPCLEPRSPERADRLDPLGVREAVEEGADRAAIGRLGAHQVAEASADGRAHGDGTHAHGAHSARTYFRAAAACNRAQCPGTPGVPGRNRKT